MAQAIKNSELLDYVQDLAQQRLAYYEPQWYACLHGYENNHFIGWNSINRSIIQMPTRKRFFIQFPEVKKQVDGFQNFMMSSNPVYQVYPTDYADPNQQDQAKQQSLFLKQHYLDYHEDNVLHSLVHNGGVMPISFMEIAATQEWDIEQGKYIHTTVPRVYDAFDILFDARYLFDQQPCIVKIIRTTSDQIAKSKYYKDFGESAVTSGTQDYKEIYYIDKFGSASTKYSNRVLLYECHIKDGPDIKIVTIDGQGRVLREIAVKNMPFWSIIPFQPSSGNAYQPSLLENLLPMNRSLDLVGNRIESMTLKYVKGSYLMQANTSVSLSDEDGTIITYKGTKPEVLKNPDMPQWAWEYMNFMQSSSDRYGYNSVVLGGVPKGSNFRSGKMMDKTNQNTLLQQKMFLDNFIYTLKRSAEVMTFVESRLLTSPRDFTLQDMNSAGDDYVTKSFVGAPYFNMYPKKEGLVKLPSSFKKLSVQIEDETTHGIEGKRATFERLAKIYPEIKQSAPELMPEFLALFLKTGDIAQVVAEARKQGTLLGSDAFQNIINNNRMGAYDDDPEFKSAMSVVMNRMSKDRTKEQGMSKLPVQTRSGSGKPIFTPQNQPEANNTGGQDAGE
jgi:hypothetical protein